jgi:hypothetical protein
MSAHEAALVLQMPLRSVRDMQRRGELVDVRPGRQRGVDVAQLAKLTVGRPLAQAVLEAIVTGRLRAPRLELDAKPLTLIETLDGVW